MFSGLSSVSTVPAGSFAKASLVGANTVNGPADSSVGTRPAAFTAATSVVWSFELTAFCTMFLDGYIAAPPTILVISAANEGAVLIAPMPSASAATPARAIERMRVMVNSVFSVCVSPWRRHQEIRSAPGLQMRGAVTGS